MQDVWDFLGRSAYANPFSSQDERDTEAFGKLKMVDVNELVEFKNHTFKLRDDEEQAKLRESIEQNGIMEPAIVFINEENQLELVSGHRRRKACMELGIENMPVLIKKLTRDEAIVMMGETNLQRREKILPSEKAFTYKTMLEAMKRQGKRTDLTSATGEQKLTSRDELAKKVNEASELIRRYIRLTNLEIGLLDLVDEGRMAMKPAVEISYLSSEQQAVVYDVFENYDKTPSHAQAIQLRKLAKESLLDKKEILRILTEEKPNQKKGYTLSDKLMEEFFSDEVSKKNIDKIIRAALQLYQKQQKILGKSMESHDEMEL